MKKAKRILPLILSTSVIPTIFVSSTCGSKHEEEDEVTYKVTLNANGGYFTETEDVIVMEDVSDLRKSDCQEPIYIDNSKVFDAWYTDQSCINKFVFGPLTSDVTLYAGWKARAEKTYDITLNANGGRFADGKETKILKDLTLLTFNDCEKPTYEDDTMIFNNWYTAKQGGTEFQFGKLSSSTTIYAHWDPVQHEDATLNDEASATAWAAANCPALTPSFDDTTKVVTLTDNTTSNEDIVVNFQGEFKGNSFVFVGNKDSKKKIIINLNETTIIGSKTDYSPILVDKNFDSAKFSVTGINLVYDARKASETYDDPEDGAITTKVKTEFNGDGTLKINDYQKYKGFDKGIQCSKKLTIKNITLSVFAVGTGIRGNKEVNIEDAQKVTVYSSTGDGIKTKDEEVGSGDINITGTTELNISTTGNAIQAQHDLNMSTSSTVTINTGKKFNTYIDESSIVIDEQDMYLSNVDATYNDAKQYNIQVVFADKSTWPTEQEIEDEVYPCESARLKKIYSEWGPPTTYFTLDRPVGNEYKYYFVRILDRLAGTEVARTTSGYSISNPGSYQNPNDCVPISSISDGNITMDTDWVSYKRAIGSTSSSVVAQRGKTVYSSKGLKAKNAINISGTGQYTFQTCDDAIQCSYGTYFSNEDGPEYAEVGIGNINLSGGTFNVIYSPDDAIHADGTLTIEGDTNINVLDCYEGLEASIFDIKGGYSHIIAADDGMNASSCGNTTVDNTGIVVSDGIVEIESYGDDVDGIDSNGIYQQTGGIVITRGGPRSPSTAIDANGTATLSGGTLICMGNIEPHFESTGYKKYSLSGKGSGVAYITGLSSGDIKITNQNNWSSFSTVIMTMDSGTPKWK